MAKCDEEETGESKAIVNTKIANDTNCNNHNNNNIYFLPWHFQYIHFVWLLLLWAVTNTYTCMCMLRTLYVCIVIIQIIISIEVKPTVSHSSSLVLFVCQVSWERDHTHTDTDKHTMWTRHTALVHFIESFGGCVVRLYLCVVCVRLSHANEWIFCWAHFVYTYKSSARKISIFCVYSNFVCLCVEFICVYSHPPQIKFRTLYKSIHLVCMVACGVYVCVSACLSAMVPSACILYIRLYAFHLFS